MIDDARSISGRLKYTGHSFPELEWNAFLKNCNATFYSSRNGLWRSIRGKGFVLWISNFRPARENDLTVWYSEVELSRSASAVALSVLKEFIEGVTCHFDKMDLEGAVANL